MCAASSECAGKGACVAGRCQVEKPTVKPAVDSARRVVLRPVDVAYVRRGDGPTEGGAPASFVLGKDGGKLFLRFDAAIPKAANVVEAYVVLRRSPVVDDDPSPISLHATRIIDAWSGRSVSWARQPRSSETRSPSTTVEPGASPLIRLDVRELVRHWARRDPNDQGIAVVAESETATGTMFALTGAGLPVPVTSTPGRAGPTSSLTTAPEVEPFLELYLR